MSRRIHPSSLPNDLVDLVVIHQRQATPKEREPESSSGSSVEELDGPRAGPAPGGACECPVCREPLFSARTTPCGHALCSTCADKVCAPPEDPYGEPSPPRCPECRAALHRTQLRRCYALEEAARRAHPSEWAARDKDAEKLSALADETGVGSLRAWKNVKDEQVVDQAVKLVWAGIRACISTSTALLLREPQPGEGRSLPPGTLMMRHGRIVHEHEEGGVSGEMDLELLVERAGVANDKEAVLGALWDRSGEGALWDRGGEVARRLEAEGLTVARYRFLGQNYALIQWPPL